MAKFETVKRATVGNLVRSDATGFDEWIVGRITASDTKRGTISYQPADGSEEITAKRNGVFKATQAEYDMQAAQPDLTITKERLDDVLNTSANVALGRSTGKAPERPTEAVEYSEAISVAEESVEDEEDGKEEPLSRIKKYVKNYETVLASSGKKSKDSGDRVAVELRGLTLDAVYEAVATALDTDIETLVAKYQHLNGGQRRMCLGNLLRGHYRRQEAAAEAQEVLND